MKALGIGVAFAALCLSIAWYNAVYEHELTERMKLCQAVSGKWTKSWYENYCEYRP